MALPPVADKMIPAVSSTDPAKPAQKAAQNPQVLQERLAQYGVSIEQSSTKVSYQASIVSHVFSNDSQTLENSLKLTYQAAIAKLNDILSPMLGEETPISEAKLQQQGMEYWTPENTSKRILEGATGFLAGFQRAHPDLAGQALMDRFNEVVGGGLRQGFEEAQTILKDLKVFDGNVKDNFDSTVSLVEAGLSDFRNNYLGISPDSNSESAEPDNSESEAPDTESKETE